MNQSTVLDLARLTTSTREKICQIWGETYDPERWNDWRWQMRHRLSKLEHFQDFLHLSATEKRGLSIAPEKFAVAVTPHFASLLDPNDSSCPLRLQVIPRQEELVTDAADMVDPCGEDDDSVVPGLVHRYPDRVLLLALDSCAAYCRYCTRSRLVSQGEMYPMTRRLDAIVAYLEEHTEVRDVLISGGDPLLMSDEPLDNLLARLRAIPHIEFVRIGSRVPGFLPQRITPELVAILRKHRVWLSLHFCHVRELTPEVARACDLLADGGIPLGSQTVLLKGVNDSERRNHLRVRKCANEFGSRSRTNRQWQRTCAEVSKRRSLGFDFQHRGGAQRSLSRSASSGDLRIIRSTLHFCRSAYLRPHLG